ncbi:CrcB protein [Microbacterium esteraromaticum]|uniref:Fluoride-specific ion channel FluC n=1 Tax=Microbacterium esteraromaticum TaxID=57043 RepID=A0A1R4KEE7_9MICO|nr:CrcB family protein [Microbacterium esteraromaticum]SJN42741.1 CrcB protein [Microbacterium esteraromaticum]
MNAFDPVAGADPIRSRAPEEDPITPLPLDSDIEVDQGSAGEPQPMHLRASSLALVFAGGVAGVAAREALTLAFPAAGGIPWAILTANLTGAFVLGILLDALARRGPDHGRRRTLRLLLGTGLIGGYTTYSALATDAVLLLDAGQTALGIGYALSTVLLGGVATWVGILVAATTHRTRAERRA